ncbi:aminoglycoside phosphotransferase family protein [Cellulomonas denverensis]|uniref:Aminoglycoside phosphotransferase family protein n=1 Tax=Cellulomonas denverensis TaxID=264297 RepID=A0A7X6KTT2_9CELL|nr:aminoglycoside phosphotransferase family protein [Cellulomonas denverensis]NKY22139.1 aminoglycoside phosphotransferase family protein [Cellulomonas denverensis]GIG26100.1 trifolitoxin immunity domain-containing protein [Cellulomonas denverensis]
MTSAPDPHPTPLAGGHVNTVIRVGDTVRRSAGPWTPTVHALLAWARARGAWMVPTPLGVDEQGREMLSWIPGTTGDFPLPDWVWHPRTVQQAGAFLRIWHDATVGFPVQAGPWRLPAHEPAEVICLNDAAPYNMVHAAGRLVGFIDIDMASPGPRVWDLAYLAYRLCSFCSDSPTPGGLDPLRRLDSLLQAYGEDAPAAADVLATMVPRLDELADWTDRHAEDSRQPELHAHADLYRRDARRLPQL